MKLPKTKPSRPALFACPCCQRDCSAEVGRLIREALHAEAADTTLRMLFAVTDYAETPRTIRMLPTKPL